MPQMLRLSDLMRLAMIPAQPEGPVQPYVPPPLSPFKQALGSGLESGVDVLLGALGLPGTPESKSRTFGELISAAMPMMAGVKALKGGLTAERAATAPKPSIKAYHGSPHDFDQFSLSKIGTGEGAQAYGHGLYFAEKEAVAKDYQKRLTEATSDVTEVLHKGQPLNLESPEAHAAKLLGNSGASTQELRAWARRTAKEAATGTDLGLEDIGKKAGMTGSEYYQRLSDFMQNATKRDVSVKRGRMYEVNIHADPNDFLDWDAPLSQQSEKARGVLNLPPQAQRLNDTFRAKGHPEMTGGNAYTEIRAAGTPGPDVSERLKQAGIPGIKYLDGASRSAGQGSRNYVVFDDKLISIVKKYGIAGALTAGLINESQARQLKARGAE